jgi:hypothetical protein
MSTDTTYRYTNCSTYKNPFQVLSGVKILFFSFLFILSQTPSLRMFFVVLMRYPFFQFFGFGQQQSCNASHTHPQLPPRFRAPKTQSKESLQRPPPHCSPPPPQNPNTKTNSRTKRKKEAAHLQHRNTPQKKKTSQSRSWLT